MTSLPAEVSGDAQDEVSQTKGGSQIAQEDHSQDETAEEERKMRDFLDFIGPAYALDFQFWKSLWFSTIPQGLILSALALAFFNFYTALADNTWKNHEMEEALSYIPELSVNISSFKDRVTVVLPSNEHADHEAGEQVIDILRLGNGEWWYVGMLAAAGFAVGLVKFLWTIIFPAHAFPEKTASFVEDVRKLRAHDIFVPIPQIVCSALSIGLGASCGPEAAMGGAGTALGQVIGQRWKIGKYQAKSISGDDDDQEDNHWISRVLPDLSNESELCVLDGIAAAFGALFPTQYLSPMLILEIGGHWGPGGRFTLTETVARMGFAATVSYALFVGVEDKTLLEQAILPTAAYNFLPTIKVIHLFEAFVLGIICGFIGLFGFIVMGIGGGLGSKTFAAFNRVGKAIGLPERCSLGLLLTPVVGGVLVGLLCVAAPLCLSDGADQIGALVTLARPLGTETIAVSGIIKIFCVSISLGFGFIGGPIFPLVFAGVCTGVVAHALVDSLPILVAVPSCLAAVPCAFVPAIFTMTTLSSMILALGGAATSPVFVACFTSYGTIVGLGVLHDLVFRVKKAAQEVEELKKKQEVFHESQMEQVQEEDDPKVDKDEIEVQATSIAGGVVK